jgi:hypothetical protein
MIRPRFVDAAAAPWRAMAAPFVHRLVERRIVWLRKERSAVKSYSFVV